jgi:hypothetical protein
MRTFHKALIGIAVVGGIISSIAVSQSPCHYTGVTQETVLQDAKCTPGVIDPNLTIQKLCDPTFRTGTVRNVPYSEKLAVAKEYGVSSLKGYEVDHLISLELGGSNDIKNLWPELGFPNPKDTVENTLHKEVCNGTITLQQAQKCISTDWRMCK